MASAKLTAYVLGSLSTRFRLSTISRLPAGTVGHTGEAGDQRGIRGAASIVLSDDEVLHVGDTQAVADETLQPEDSNRGVVRAGGAALAHLEIPDAAHVIRSVPGDVQAQIAVVTRLDPRTKHGSERERRVVVRGADIVVSQCQVEQRFFTAAGRVKGSFREDSSEVRVADHVVDDREHHVHVADGVYPDSESVPRTGVRSAVADPVVVYYAAHVPVVVRGCRRREIDHIAVVPNKRVARDVEGQVAAQRVPQVNGDVAVRERGVADKGGNQSATRLANLNCTGPNGGEG